MNISKTLEKLQRDLAESMLREQDAKEQMAVEMRDAAAKSLALAHETAEETLKRARVERETFEMIQRATAEAIAQNRNPLQQYD